MEPAAYSGLRLPVKAALLPGTRPAPDCLPDGKQARRSRLSKTFYLIGGFLALGLGGIGIVLPLLPTVPFVILAAFCFARSSKPLERWLVEHPAFSPHIRMWRERGAISRKGKQAALAAFATSAVIALVFVSLPYSLAPLGAALIGGTWIWTRPEA
ncbi:MAG: YbaN family protein [Parvibaculum sp.]|nr:YbaN family protein [Parvibaculum sp.]MBO6691734.1 YbaN family protein [Parvibaculum sp.]MBO6714682.1 YbaN family protein [Parvibaculum sp.]